MLSLEFAMYTIHIALKFLYFNNIMAVKHLFVHFHITFSVSNNI